MSTTRLRPVPDEPRRAIALVRVSKVGDRGDDLTSPEIQRMKITEYAQQRGLVVVEWVEALDESGSRANSPWWRRLDAAVEQVEAGTVDAILVWRLSRAARNRRRWAVAIDRVDVAGGSLESATEQIDATTSTGRLARGMLAELAAWEADVKGEVWQETFERRRRAGLGHSSYPRLGYLLVDRQYVVDDAAAGIVREAYRRYVTGDGFREIAEWLNTLGVRQPRSGMVWSPKTVRRFLDSGWAAGLIVSGGQHLPGAHTALIDAKTWQAYQRVRGRRVTVPPRLRRPASALSGLMRCGSCGRSMRLKHLPPHREGRPRRPIYACEVFGCPRPTYVSVRRAVAGVLEWLRPLVDHVDVREVAKAADDAARAVARADRTRLGREVTRLDTALTRLTTDLASGLVLPADYRSARDELAEQRQRAVDAMNAVAEVTDRPRPTPRVIRHLLDGWGGMDEVGRNRALAEVVWKVEVYAPAAPGERSIVRPFGAWERP